MKKVLTVAATVAACLSAFACFGCNKTAGEKRSLYTIDATLSSDNVLTVSMTLDYVNNYDVPLDRLSLHLYPQAYREGAAVSAVPDTSGIYPAGKSYSVFTIDALTVNGTTCEPTIEGSDEDILTVATGNISPTESVTIGIDYTLKLPQVKHRLGYSNGRINLGNFYPIACVYEGGEFDTTPYYSIGEPFYSECSDYAVTFTVPENLKGAFSGTVTKTESVEECEKYTVSAINVRDFAAVFGEFETLSAAVGDTLVEYYYVSDSEAELSLKTATDALKTFEEKFGEYPYSHYSVVQTSFMPGGMEYPQLVYISDTYTGSMYREIIIHETAHQWWYGLVGNDEASEPWLDEALAEYSTALFYDLNPDYNATTADAVADALTAYMLYCELYKDDGKGDTSMTRAVNEYSNETEYSYMAYVKGELMLNSIHERIGDEAFFSGLNAYCTNMRYKNATAADLVGALEKASNRPLAQLFDSWLSGKVRLYSDPI